MGSNPIAPTNRKIIIMNEYLNPIEFLIEFAWANGADRSTVNNAKDQVKKLQEDSKDSERWFSCEQELATLKEKIKNGKFTQQILSGHSS
jgi:hypothetical protein